MNPYGIVRMYGQPSDPLDGGELSWMDRALCAEVDPDLHFPEKGGTALPAKRVCRACEVRAECLEYALEHNEAFGVWGGFSEEERSRLKRLPGTVADLIAAGTADQEERREATAQRNRAKVRAALARKAATDSALRDEPAADPAPSRKAA